MFKSFSENLYPELEYRETNVGDRLSFGIDYLDDACHGISRNDVILIGARSGIGKTQLCCNIAQENVKNGKRVHYIALEASNHEIEQRIKYKYICDLYFADPDKPKLKKYLNYPDWQAGDFLKELAAYEIKICEELAPKMNNFFIYYKSDKFGISELIQSVLYCEGKTDLIIIDHVHYFDFDDENELRAIREIAKMVRSLALENDIPIILVAHLRKANKTEDELVADLEEFHGSSDLYKIATKVVTVAAGRPTSDGCYETYFRVPKNRVNGSVTRYIAKEIFNPKTGGYEKNKYELGWATQKRRDGFKILELSKYPEWARQQEAGLGNESDNNPPRRRYSTYGSKTKPSLFENKVGERII